MNLYLHVYSTCWHSMFWHLSRFDLTTQMSINWFLNDYFVCFSSFPATHTTSFQRCNNLVTSNVVSTSKRRRVLDSFPKYAYSLLTHSNLTFSGSWTSRKKVPWGPCSRKFTNCEILSITFFIYMASIELPLQALYPYIYIWLETSNLNLFMLIRTIHLHSNATTYYNVPCNH